MPVNSWRMIKSSPGIEGPMQMAIDEALMMAVGSNKSAPVLRWYSWNSPSVAIGYFQSLREEVNYEQCIKDGVEIFRRMTGGGAVYKYPKGEINYSIITLETEELHDILSSYSILCQPIISYLKRIGLNAQFSGINDIVVNGKKISGNAQTRMHNAILQHGTILLDFDVDGMARYLKISKEKLSDKQLESIKDRVTWIRKNISITNEELMQGIRDEYEKQFGIKIIDSIVSAEETIVADRLCKKKYATEEWLWMR
jgi:lipoate---protein ligase